MAVKIVPSANGSWYFPDNLMLGSWIGGGSLFGDKIGGMVLLLVGVACVLTWLSPLVWCLFWFQRDSRAPSWQPSHLCGWFSWLPRTFHHSHIYTTLTSFSPSSGKCLSCILLKRPNSYHWHGPHILLFWITSLSGAPVDVSSRRVARHLCYYYLK